MNDRPTPADPGTPIPWHLLPSVGDPVSSLWHRLRRGTRLLRRQPDWDRFAGEDWPGRVMGEVVADKLHAKQGRSIARWTLAAGRVLLGDVRAVQFVRRVSNRARRADLRALTRHLRQIHPHEG